MVGVHVATSYKFFKLLPAITVKTLLILCSCSIWNVRSSELFGSFEAVFFLFFVFNASVAHL